MSDWKELLSGFILGTGIDLMALKSGIFGGFISLTFEKKRGPLAASGFIFTSAVFAGYIGPVLQEWFELSDRAANGASFLVGFLAVRVLIPRLYEYAEAVTAAAILKKKNGEK